MQAIPESGQISIRIEAENSTDGRLGEVVKISDTGTGVPSEALSHVFDLGFSTKAGRGAGLGLWISRKIVELHGGALQIDSKPGQGTEISAWFPL